MGATLTREPQVIKISSKRQITIPIDCYRELGFDNYALVTWTDRGIEIQPIATEDESAAVAVLRMLVSQGLEGDELVEAFASASAKIASTKQLLAEAEVAAGRVGSDLEQLTNEIKAAHGL